MGTSAGLVDLDPHKSHSPGAESSRGHSPRAPHSLSPFLIHPFLASPTSFPVLPRASCSPAGLGPAPQAGLRVTVSVAPRQLRTLPVGCLFKGRCPHICYAGKASPEKSAALTTTALLSGCPLPATPLFSAFVPPPPLHPTPQSYPDPQHFLPSHSTQCKSSSFC